MTAPDAFEDLARYYDPLMNHVNYDRWFSITVALAEMLPPPFRHLDAACGTATLVQLLRQTGWDSAGVDLSPAMLRAARKRGAFPLAASDLRALPFGASFDLITCLFDSLNFLLDEKGLAAAFRQFHGALADGGILYADIITERMVTDHFEGQEWVEENDGFQSRWASSYDKQRALAESRVQVNTGNVCTILERVFELPRVVALLEEAGFEILGTLDADNWKAPRKKTTRVDIVAVKNGDPGMERRFQKAAKQVRALVYGG